jgi:hypothetical protein
MSISLSLCRFKIIYSVLPQQLRRGLYDILLETAKKKMVSFILLSADKSTYYGRNMTHLISSTLFILL